MASISETQDERTVRLLLPLWIKWLGAVSVSVVSGLVVAAAFWAASIDRQLTKLNSTTESMQQIEELRFTLLKERIDRMDENGRH